MSQNSYAVPGVTGAEQINNAVSAQSWMTPDGAYIVESAGTGGGGGGSSATLTVLIICG